MTPSSTLSHRAYITDCGLINLSLWHYLFGVCQRLGTYWVHSNCLSVFVNRVDVITWLCGRMWRHGQCDVMAGCDVTWPTVWWVGACCPKASYSSLISDVALDAPVTSRQCQLGPQHQKSRSLRPLSMSQLKQWQHFSGDHLNLTDPFLERIRGNASFFFQNITNQAPAVQWRTTSYRSFAPLKT